MKKSTKSLLALGLVTSLGFAGYQATSEHHEKLSAASCDPLMGANFVSKAPPRVETLRKMSWIVTNSTFGDLAITYYRDCGIEVRGPIDSQHPLGPLLMSTMCEKDKTAMIFADPKVENDLFPVNERIPSSVIEEAESLKPHLLDSPVCADHKVTIIEQQLQTA